MKARIQWAGEALFIGESGSGHAVVMDGPPDAGGRNLGVRPMEMLLLGVGGCSNFDVVSILKKSRQAVESCEAFLEAERADDRRIAEAYSHGQIIVDALPEYRVYFEGLWQAIKREAGMGGVQ